MWKAAACVPTGKESGYGAWDTGRNPLAWKGPGMAGIETGFVFIVLMRGLDWIASGNLSGSFPCLPANRAPEGVVQ